MNEAPIKEPIDIVKVSEVKTIGRFPVVWTMWFKQVWKEITTLLATVAGLPITKEYATTEQTITAGGALGPFAHGFGTIPKIVKLFLVCKTAELGYSQNAVIPINYNAVDASNTYGVALQMDSTNINIRFGTTNAAFVLDFGTGGGPNAITPANWKFIVRAYA